MKFIKNEEEAVSPVIGVILMVAIVVILAAVIAAFVFGMAGSTATTKIVSVTGQQQGSDKIILTYQGGKDARDVSELTYTVTPEDSTVEVGMEDQFNTADDATDPLAVGDTVVVTATGGELFSGKDHVVVVATFLDGSSQVILDTYI